METIEERAARLGMTMEQVKELSAPLASMSAEDLEAAKLIARGTLARELPFGVEGFKHFYWCVWRRELQPYAENEWVPAFVAGWAILECFRGSGKTTDLSVSFIAYALGKEPWTSALIIQANDETAGKTSALIADFVENFSGWKLCFPNIVPDKERGWGAQGYFLKDVSMDYTAWLEKCALDHTKDPSLVGVGIASSVIRGMHPKWLLMDDIHDKSNSSFPRERKNIVDTVRVNILPVITKPKTAGKAWVGVACTPWSKDDAYHVLADTGMFSKVSTPLYWKDPDGEYEIDGEKVSLAWPEGFPIETIRATMNSYKGSRVEFAREYLCDLEAAKTMLYKWYSYPAENVDIEKWPLVGGVDYASVYLPTLGREGGLSWFAEARVAVTPTGGAVVVDGILEQCTQADAETYVMRDQNMYPTWRYVVIESDGIGAQFIQLLQRNPRMRVIPKRTGEIFRGSKAKRQYEVLSPLFERAILRVSDANTPFLNTLRSYLDNYPNIESHEPEWDVADAVLWATVGIPELSDAAKIDSDDERIAYKEKKANPYDALTKAY